MTRLRVLPLSGLPYELGYAHGTAYASDIQMLTEERVRLATSPFWTGGRGATLAEVLAAGEACLAAHEAYSPALMDEMRGMADATGLGLNELVIMNGFTDFIDTIAALPVPGAGANRLSGAAASASNGAGNGLPTSDNTDAGGCTAFLVAPSASVDGQPWIGQTWDMHASATPHVILLDMTPAEAPALLAFTITGCVGMIGINEHGVAVGINNLQASDGRPGVHWPYVVRQMLAQRTVDAALHELQRAPLSGAHNYVLMGYTDEGALHGYNIEAGSTHKVVTPLADVSSGVYVHTNHCLAPEMADVERTKKAMALDSTTTRYRQASTILQGEMGAVTLESLMALTRYEEPGTFSICAHTRPDYDVETSGAAIMAPATRELWAAWGAPNVNPYEHFTVRQTREASVA